MGAITYFDHNATAPLLPEVLEAMLPWMGQHAANPSSQHQPGRAARSAIENARAQVAQAVGAQPDEIIFTASGTEANNLFLKGTAALLSPTTIAVSAIEHPCVREPARQLRAQGWRLHEIWVDRNGLITAKDFENALTNHPALFSMIYAHNETGVIQDIAHWARLARQTGALFHTDAVQTLGKHPIHFGKLGVDGMTLSAHKIGGPQGAGALVLRQGVALQPLIAGGGQEHGLRSGTENVAAIVGFGKAAQLVLSHQAEEMMRQTRLRHMIEDAVQVLGGTVFAQSVLRIPNTIFFAFPGCPAESLVGILDAEGFAVSSGAACSGAHPQPSRALIAMGVDPVLAQGAVRISLGISTTQDQVQRLITVLSQYRQAAFATGLLSQANAFEAKTEMYHA